jgi:hypothetical protein
MGEMINEYRIFVGKYESLRDISVDGSTILK